MLLVSLYPEPTELFSLFCSELCSSSFAVPVYMLISHFILVCATSQGVVEHLGNSCSDSEAKRKRQWTILLNSTLI